MIAPEWVERVKADARAAGVMAARFQRDDGLPAYDAAMMTQSLALPRFYEAARVRAAAKLAANWLMGEVEQAPERRGRDRAGAVATAALAR